SSRKSSTLTAASNFSDWSSKKSIWLSIAENGTPSKRYFSQKETHYYPFGLVMHGISTKAIGFGDAANRRKYQQYELNEDFQINLNESFYRLHDPQIGRFLQIDPKPIFEME